MEANFASDDNHSIHLPNDANWLFFFERPFVLFGRHDIPIYIDCTSSSTFIIQRWEV